MLKALTSLRRKLALYLICALFLFLPFSSWLVSISGDPRFSLVRDSLIGGLLILSLFKLKLEKKNLLMLLPAAVFLILGVLSYFWREASLLQWLRGARFLFGPVVLFFSVINFNFTKQEKKTIYYSLLIGSLILTTIAILELLNIKIPVTSKYSSEGSITDVHHVGTLAITRLASILAGPNALGLYLIGAISLSIGAFKTISSRLFYLTPLFILVLLLTYSRSSLLGFLFIALSALFLYLKEKAGLAVAISLAAFLLSLLFLVFALMYRNHATKEFLTHNDSSTLRYREYSRIWNSRHEIGLLGRGTGTAGPSSQNRLDYGPNHYTENVYLDIFEELGYVGLSIYLLLLLTVFLSILQVPPGPERYTGLLLFLGFSFSGIFINYYTGQVGIFVFWLINGIITKKEAT